jgi:hypothetical protein
MKKFLLIFLVPFIVNAAQISGEIELLAPSGAIKLGSFVEVRLLLGPKGEKYLNDLEKGRGTNFFEGFYLQEIKNAQVLQGGDDYLEADLTLVMIAPLNPNTPKVWKVGETSITLTLKNFTSDKPDLQPKGFIILEQGVKKNLLFIKLGIALLALLILLLGYFLWKRAKNKSVQKEAQRIKREKIDYWKELILNASDRSALEKIYIEREDWLILIPSLRDSTANFFSVIQKHQYRPSWTDVEIEEIKTSMESLKRMIHGI